VIDKLPKGAQIAAPSASEIADAVVNKLPRPAQSEIPSAAEIAREVVRLSPQGVDNGQKVQDLMAALNASNKARDEAVQELNKERSQTSAKSPVLGLDDTRRGSLAKSMMNSSGVDGGICQVTLNLHNDQSSPDSKKSIEMWSEWQEILYVAGWRFLQSGNRTLFPPGISIYVGASSGPTFTCATHLKDFLESLNIEPVTIHINESTADLIACKNECIQVAAGITSSP
jgi:hypothetical protein